MAFAQGPPPLAEVALERWRRGDGAELVAAWLRDDEQDPVSRYLARASAGPVLEALARAAGLEPGDTAEGRRCPVCGGLPQVASFPGALEALVTAPRHLVCSRCQHTWIFARMTCAGCGEQSGSKLPIYGDLPTVNPAGSCKSRSHCGVIIVPGISVPAGGLVPNAC